MKDLEGLNVSMIDALLNYHLDYENAKLMAQKNHINHFDRSKPFYPLVIAYIVFLHGVIELSSRGIINKLKKLRKEGKDITKILEETKLKPEILEKIKTLELTPLVGDLSLRSELQNNNIEVDINDIAEDLLNNCSYLFNSGSPFAATYMLLISAYEITNDYRTKNNCQNDPLWQFFRHCRNASAHNGKFYLKNGEPRCTAKWDKFEILKTMDNTRLFKNNPTDSALLSIGDPIRLLWDIEQTYSDMKV